MKTQWPSKSKQYARQGKREQASNNSAQKKGSAKGRKLMVYTPASDNYAKNVGVKTIKICFFPNKILFVLFALVIKRWFSVEKKAKTVTRKANKYNNRFVFIAIITLLWIASLIAFQSGCKPLLYLLIFFILASLRLFTFYRESKKNWKSHLFRHPKAIKWIGFVISYIHFECVCVPF